MSTQMSSMTYEPQPAESRLVLRLDALRTAARRFPLSLLEFGMRLAVGATFFRSGMNKVQSFDTAITLFRDEFEAKIIERKHIPVSAGALS